MDIDKAEMDQAWVNRNTSDKLYNYLYDIARLQVARNGSISYSDREDYIQFALFKCFKHQDSFTLSKGRAYSFFWKQISLSIAYKMRKIRRRNNKVITIFVEEEKLLDWADNIQQKTEGASFKDIVDIEELQILKSAFKKYNSSHKGKRVKPNKKNAIKVVKWMDKKSPGFIESFTTLKRIFKDWMEDQKESKTAYNV